MKGHATLMSKASDEWATPQEFFDVVNTEFGPFTLDAAATLDNTTCARFMDAQADALRPEPWGDHESVWLNPPYSRIRHFMAKAAHEGERNTVVCLVPARTDTRWWHDACVHALEVRLLKGRLSFGGAAASAPFPSALLVFRPDRNKGFYYESYIHNWDWRNA